MGKNENIGYRQSFNVGFRILDIGSVEILDTVNQLNLAALHFSFLVKFE